MSFIVPTVTWNNVTLSRLLVGHNPFKAQSHFTAEMDAEMGAWFADRERIVEQLQRCEECGITTAQFGGEVPHWALEEHKRRGGHMNWVATFYGNTEGDLGAGPQLAHGEELEAILRVNPRPIGLQHFGANTDTMFMNHMMPVVRERMKWLRDTGCLVGVGTHLPEVVELCEEQGWDVDFYETCFYTVYSHTREGIRRESEYFDDDDRDAMVKVIKQASKPCLAFKVLGGNRKCGTDAEVRAALEFAYANIKPNDVVCLGMWQKYRDQVAEDAALVSEILASGL